MLTDPSVTVALIAFGAGIGITVVGLLAVTLMQKALRDAVDYILERAQGMVSNIYATRAMLEPVDAKRQRDIAEAQLFDLVKLRENVDEQIARAQHVAGGGRPDDSPTKWKKGKTTP